MTKVPTAEAASHLYGKKLYHERARNALPILVRQAKARTPIQYEILANELGMPNPRNLNFPLGSIGNTLEDLGGEWGVEIPIIQGLVYSKTTGLPGDGVEGFLKDKEYSKLTKQDRKRLVDKLLEQVYAFTKWDKVLMSLGLEPSTDDFTPDIKDAGDFRGGGEGEAHKNLKLFISERPNLVGFSRPIETHIEQPLPSGDSIDVGFMNKKEWLGVEVKSSVSKDADITRGIFQCVKYRAVMEAVVNVNNTPISVDSVLVLENKISARLRQLSNMLGVVVFDDVRS